jgi:hypothetical protein
MASKVPQVATRLPRDVRTKVEERIREQRQRTGSNVTISDWIRVAVVERLAREVALNGPTAPEPIAPVEAIAPVEEAPAEAPELPAPVEGRPATP